ncbi:hypothetical protein [Salinispora arenicola]|uniref:hypothetical protein n=1 Tax=Salinispora arenicola TaxID=168697 RepID=UPI00037570D4|nr:hypothetical protein [Salinispora arenicola]
MRAGRRRPVEAGEERPCAPSEAGADALGGVVAGRADDTACRVAVGPARIPAVDFGGVGIRRTNTVLSRWRMCPWVSIRRKRRGWSSCVSAAAVVDEAVVVDR